jgi:hypothetical protein
VFTVTYNFIKYTPDDVDQVICAEIPPDPQQFPEGPQREQAERLQQIIINNHVHKCSSLCLDENSVCKKGFPKEFSEITEWDENAFYPKYRRRSPLQGGRTIYHKGRLIDNRWIVPYSPFLALKYAAHINVEACVSPKAAKYLFKYVTKGSDRAMVSVDCYDEIKDYQNMRSIGSSEACWRIFGFSLTERFPAVMALRVHLPGEEYIIFNGGQENQIVEQGSRKTELTEFFAYNAGNPNTQIKYIDFPKNFTWIQGQAKRLP